MATTTLIQIVLLGWSFGPIGSDAPNEDTIGSLDSREVVIPEPTTKGATSAEALEYYRKYLESPDTDATMRMEALRRMGDLNIKEGENAQFSDSDYNSDMVFHNDAILIYEELLANGGDYAKADLVLYQLSRAYESLGAQQKALVTLDRLVTEFPGSQYIDEAQFRRGEILFSRKEFYDAGQAYGRVVAWGDSSTFYEQSLYKQGWSLFKQAEYDLTLTAFLDLLALRLQDKEQTPISEFVMPDGEGFANNGQAEFVARVTQDAIALEAKFDEMTRPERELVDDTLRALSLTFSYLEGGDTIAAVVEARGNRDPAYLLYTSLGELYLEKERYLDAAETFSTFARQEPYHRVSPDMTERAIVAYKEGQFPSKVLEGKREYVELFGLHSAYWTFHDPQERDDVIQPLKQNLTELAQYDHAEAQKTGDLAAYARAAEWYRRYLDYFPNDPDSAERHFLLGEVLVETGEFAEANDSFLAAAYNYPGYEKAAEAGYAALLASRSHHATLATDFGEDFADEWMQQQLRQALTFARTFPEHEQASAVLSNTAEIYFADAELDEAIVVAGALLLKEPMVSIDMQQVGWTIVALGHFDLEHYPRAEQAYKELRFLGGNDNLSLAEIDARIAASVYRQGEAAQLAGDIDAAVGHYLRVETEVPGSDIAPQARYDASVLLFNEKRWDESIEIMTAFRADYPNHEFSNSITQNLAIAYTAAAMPVAAASEYERIAAFSGDDPEVRREAVWKSAELYEESGEIASARRVWRQYVNEFPEPVVEAIEVRQRLADLARQVADTRDRRDWLAAIIAADAGAGEARNDRTKTLAGRARIELAEPKRQSFNAVRLQIPLADSLKRKKALMEDALESYTAAADYGIAEITTVATFRIAELYQQLSKDLMESERPDGLGADELEQYEILLEEQAFPFEEKAIEIYQANTVRAASGVYDVWVAKSYEQLAVLMPARFAKFEKTEDHVARMY